MRKLIECSVIRLIALAALLAWMASMPALAQSRGTEAIKAIEFAHGKRSALLRGSVQPPHGEGDMHNDGADRYSLHYRAGERLTLNLESEGGRAVFSISRIDSGLQGLPSLKTKWTGRLPESGDYYITVWTREAAARYTLSVSLRQSR